MLYNKFNFLSHRANLTVGSLLPHFASFFLYVITFNIAVPLTEFTAYRQPVMCVCVFFCGWMMWTTDHIDRRIIVKVNVP